MNNYLDLTDETGQDIYVNIKYIVMFREGPKSHSLIWTVESKDPLIVRDTVYDIKEKLKYAAEYR